MLGEPVMRRLLIAVVIDLAVSAAVYLAGKWLRGRRKAP